MSNKALKEASRAVATAALSAAVAAIYFLVAGGAESVAFAPKPAAEQAQVEIPDRPAGGRRWRSSNAEQSLPVLRYFGEADHWARYGAALKDMRLEIAQMLPSAEVARNGIRVTLGNDYLAAYLDMPFLGTEADALPTRQKDGQPFVVGPVLARSFAKQQLAQR